MDIHYYLTLYPMEAMIASQLDSEAFGAYMAVGNRKGSSERLIFVEVVEEKIADSFDIDYARRRCIQHSDGRLKNSVYLSVYRALEATPISALGLLWLTTKDGRSLALKQGAYTDLDPWTGTALYQELCPAHPLVVSALNPKHFAEYIVEDSSKVTMPSIFFAELGIPDLENPAFTGNVGGYFDHMLEHLNSCVADLKAGKGKMSKIVDRSADVVFNYQVIGRGLYISSNEDQLAFYP
ncbi:MAG: hypothetical protein RQ801_03655, partial [Spirochaetaceae bacterium]|nr:hypothetical protein [Spirochaetaceae bacterium]